MHRRGGDPPLGPRGRARPGRPAPLARPARRPDDRCLPRRRISPARCATASAPRATSSSASRSCSPTARSSNAGGKVVQERRRLRPRQARLRLARPARLHRPRQPPPPSRPGRGRDGGRRDRRSRRRSRRRCSPRSSSRARSTSSIPAASRCCSREAPRRSRRRSRRTSALVGGEEADAAVWAESRSRPGARRSDGRRSHPASCGHSSRAPRAPSSAPPPASRTFPYAVADETPEPVRLPAGAGARALRPGRSARVTRRARRPALADERLRPLRLLPADVPDLPALERGDGLAARPDPADGVAPRRHDLAQPDRDRALRPLPRLHGLRDRLPLGRAVREADRGDARDDRDRDAPPVRRPVRARRALQAAPLPAADGPGAASRAARPQAAAARTPRRDDRDRPAVALDREAGADYARGWRDRAGVSAFSQVACSPWCSGRSTRPRRGFSRPTATRSWRRRRAAAARSRCTPAAARKGARSRVGRSRRSRASRR